MAEKWLTTDKHIAIVQLDSIPWNQVEVMETAQQFKNKFNEETATTWLSSQLEFWRRGTVADLPQSGHSLIEQIIGHSAASVLSGGNAFI